MVRSILAIRAAKVAGESITADEAAQLDAHDQRLIDRIADLIVTVPVPGFDLHAALESERDYQPTGDEFLDVQAEIEADLPTYDAETRGKLIQWLLKMMAAQADQIAELRGLKERPRVSGKRPKKARLPKRDPDVKKLAAKHENDPRKTLSEHAEIVLEKKFGFRWDEKGEKQRKQLIEALLRRYHRHRKASDTKHASRPMKSDT
jgi:hypothetical protein